MPFDKLETTYNSNKISGGKSESDITLNIQNMLVISQQNHQIEQVEKLAYLELFHSNLDNIWEKGSIPNVDNSINKVEINKTKDPELNEKEKIKQYALLANLSYACFDKIDINEKVSISNLKIKEINLDIGNLDFTKFDINNDGKLISKNNEELSYDEKFIMTSFNEIKSNDFAFTSNDKNINDILDVSIFRNKQELEYLASERMKPQYLVSASDILDRGTKSDANNGILQENKDSKEEIKIKEYTKFIEENRGKLSKSLYELKEDKLSEYKDQFNEIKKKGGLEILARYPEEGSENTGGFQCVLFEQNNKKILSITGTQLTDIGDLGADLAILFGRIPQTQTKRMIDFFEKNIKEGDDIIIIGHSLGGTLSQIASSMYGYKLNIEETYTFNSPGAKNLEYSIKDDDSYKEYFNNFTNNLKRDKIDLIENKIVNVKGSLGLSFISKKGVDIGKYKVDVETYKHGIEALINAIENSKTLVKKRIEDKENLIENKDFNPVTPTSNVGN